MLTIDPNGLFLVFLVLAIMFVFVFLIPVGHILVRTGYSGAWSLLFVVPFVCYIALWIFAFAEWPGMKPKIPDAAEHF